MGFVKPIARFSVLLLLFLIGSFSSTTKADEVVIDGKRSSKVVIGDFDCSTCATPSASVLGLFDGRDSVSVTAGELWRFFHEQGVGSVDRLTLCLDVQATGNSALTGINSMELKIEDPSNLGSLLTDVSLGDNSLRIPGYEVASFKPEAKLEYKLGYDFMQRFSADSTELVSLVVTGDGNSSPVVSIEGAGGDGFFSNIVNSLALGAFAIFWALVFVGLNRLTRRQVDLPNPKNANPRNHRALSA